MKKINFTAEDIADHDAVGAIISDDQGRILMQQHVKYGFWTVPIGKTYPGNSPEEGVQREVLEECGIIIEDFQKLDQKTIIYERKGRMVTVRLTIFKVNSYSGEIENKEPSNHTRQEFKDIEEIKNMPHLSDATLLYLETTGYKRPARIKSEHS